MNQEIKPGTKVHYTAPHGKKENGIVKSLNDIMSIAWVVYDCNDEWDKYFQYTGVATNIQDITYGWVDKNGSILPEFCDHHYTPTNAKWQPENQRQCDSCGHIIN